METVCQVVENNILVNARGDDSLESIIQRNYKMAVVLAKQQPELKPIHIEMKKWISILKNKYIIKQGDKNSQGISKVDAKKLKDTAENWLEILKQCYSKEGLVLLKESSIDNMISDPSIKKLKSMAQKDLKEGIMCVDHLFPTLAAIMLLRVGKSVLQDYYYKIMKKKHGKKTCGMMINDLEQTKKVPKSLLGYFSYLNEKRIDAAHPIRRFEQKECKEILININDLIKTMHLNKNRIKK